jgi:T5SS/PEP-CTERM-associated repeat protein
MLVRFLFCALALACLEQASQAKNWADGTGNWSVPGNWSPAAVPVGGEAVNIVFNDATSRTVTLDISPPTLGLVSIDQAGAGAVTTLSITSNVSMTAGALLVGGYTGSTRTAGTGAVVQSAGAVAMSPGLDLGLANGGPSTSPPTAVSTGTYTLSGGTFTAPQSEFIGYGGNGTFNQSGGTNTVQSGAIGYFDIAALTGSTGAYNLSGGQLSVSKSEIIGDSGMGTFAQTGGTNTLSGSNSMYLGNSAGGSGTYTASGTAVLNVGADVNVGFAATGSGVFNVQNGASVNISGALNIGAGDQVNLSGGILAFNGYTRNASATPGVFNFTGGLVSLLGDRFMNSDPTILDIFGANATISNGRNLKVRGLATIGSGAITVSNATFDATSGLNVGATGHVNGGLTLQNGASATDFGVSIGRDAGTTGIVNVTGVGTTWNTVDIFVGDSGQGTLSITGGATVNSGDAEIGFANNTIVSTATVSGAGTTWNVFDMNIGNGFSGRANTLTVSNKGLVNIQTSLVISPNCKLILNGGTVHFDSLTNNGTFEYDAGTIGLTNNRTIGTDPIINQFFGVAPTMGAEKGLIVDGTATISTALTLNGGKLTATNIVANGPLQFSGGVLELTGGTITGISNLGIPTNGEFRARGTQAFRVNGAAGSTITATGTLSMGDSTLVNGFSTQGTLAVGANSVTVLDANDAVFDSSSLVTLGSGATLGSLTSTNGLTVDFGGNITGFGTVTTPNNSAKPLINNGHISGTSAGSPITLPGYVKGVGTFDQVVFTGTYSPGFSPASVTAGSITFGSTSTLTMELGGTTAGSQYDQILATGALGFGGTLQVSLINSFTPAAGQSFNLFDWGTKSGTFNALSLPSLGSSLAWDTSQLYTTGVLSVASTGTPGDYNNNGIVDAGDYVLYRKYAGTTHVLPNDPTGGTIGTIQYNTWRSHFGQPPGSGSGLDGAQVPEPATLVLFVSAASLAIGFGRRKRVCRCQQ